MHINFTRKNDDEVKNMNNYHQEIIRNLKHLKIVFSTTQSTVQQRKEKSWNRKKGVIIRDCLFLDWCVKFKNGGWGEELWDKKHDILDTILRTEENNFDAKKKKSCQTHLWAFVKKMTWISFLGFFESNLEFEYLCLLKLFILCILFFWNWNQCVNLD